MVALGDKLLWRPVVQQCLYLYPEGIPLTLTHTPWTPELLSGELLGCQRLYRALGNQIALNPGSHGLCHRDDLTLDTIIQPPVAFYCAEVDPFLGNNREDFHALQHATAETRQLADDDGIASSGVVQDLGNLAVSPGDFTQDFFLDKLDVPQIQGVGQAQNVSLGLFQILLHRGDMQAGGNLRHWWPLYCLAKAKTSFRLLF